jgi:DNA invertase Pin-like site-specific DNA recombinase
METQKYVAYYRVSTAKQGASGLGLEGQRTTVQKFVNCDTCIIAEYTDIESGKNDARPELQKAIAHAAKNGAKLVIAKLDRLSRNLTFVSSLMDSKIKFVCCDNPTANDMNIQILAIFAQQEREMISQRTKAALDAKKAVTGEWRKGKFTNEARAKAMETIKSNAANNANTEKAKDYAKLMRSNGSTLEQIAETLNKKGFLTARNKAFQKTTIKRLLEC